MHGAASHAGGQLFHSTSFPLCHFFSFFPPFFFLARLLVGEEGKGNNLRNTDKTEEIENATEEMDLALVDKNSKAWEDLIVKRVAKQMQMK